MLIVMQKKIRRQTLGLKSEFQFPFSEGKNWWKRPGGSGRQCHGQTPRADAVWVDEAAPQAPQSSFPFCRWPLAFSSRRSERTLRQPLEILTIHMTFITSSTKHVTTQEPWGTSPSRT